MNPIEEHKKFYISQLKNYFNNFEKIDFVNVFNYQINNLNIYFRVPNDNNMKIDYINKSIEKIKLLIEQKTLFTINLKLEYDYIIFTDEDYLYLENLYDLKKIKVIELKNNNNINFIFDKNIYPSLETIVINNMNPLTSFKFNNLDINFLVFANNKEVEKKTTDLQKRITRYNSNLKIINYKLK